MVCDRNELGAKGAAWDKIISSVCPMADASIELVTALEHGTSTTDNFVPRRARSLVLAAVTVAPDIAAQHERQNKRAHIANKADDRNTEHNRLDARIVDHR